jgi:hypothetical protein
MTLMLAALSVLIWMRLMSFFNDRARRTAPSRRALKVAGVATLAFSLVISIAPALVLAAPGIGGSGGTCGNGGSGGAGGGGNAGTVKVHDATTNLEAGETANEPWVCSFWIGFYTTDTPQTGAWQVVSWPPTGDQSVVATGDYDTSGDGVDTTVVFSLAEGHYRLEWEAAANMTSKHKTFWVACEPEDELVDPSNDPAASDEESPSVASSPSGEASPSQDESQPSDEALPSNGEESAPADPEQEVQAGNPEQGSHPGTSGGHQAPAQDGPSALPDTATSTSTKQSGVLATIGVLLILAAHAGTRRQRTLPSA